jgi:hypothetical protein
MLTVNPFLIQQKLASLLLSSNPSRYRASFRDRLIPSSERTANGK